MSDLTATNCGCLPACGSSFCSPAVAAVETDLTETDAETTAACGSSFCSAAAAASETDLAAADVDADPPECCAG